MPQQVEVNEAVGIGVKNVPTSIAALSYMMRNVQGDHASQTSHGRHKISEKLENVPSVPRFPVRKNLSPTGSQAIPFRLTIFFRSSKLKQTTRLCHRAPPD